MELIELQKKKAELGKRLDALNIRRAYDTNKLKLPVTVIKPDESGMADINGIISLLYEFGYEKKVILTKSGGIRKVNHCGFAIFKRPAFIEVIAITVAGSFRVQFNSNADVIKEAGGMTGRSAYSKMKREFKKDGIDLADYATDSGIIVKQTIEKPKISTTASVVFGNTYEHVHHLDIHSAYPSGLAHHHPELKPTIERIYNQRKASADGKKLKLALDASIGYFQSEYCVINKNKYALANLSRDAIRWCNKTINEITVELLRQGYTPLGYNTDGIWYAKFENGASVPSQPLHCGLEGDTLGTYANDHLDCTIRWKSRGCYEFIENGVYKPVVRGSTRLDKLFSRTEWKWGDIYQDDAAVLKYRWNGRFIEEVR